MVAIHLVAAGATLVGLFASVVKVIHHEVQKHNRKRQEMIANSDNMLAKQDDPKLLTAEIIINGKSHKFVKKSDHIFAHYDLAIDYCINNANELGLSISSFKSCIYPLSSIVSQEFQEIFDLEKRGSEGTELAISERRPKELLLSIPVAENNISHSEDMATKLPTPTSSPALEGEGNRENVRRTALEINSVNYIFEYTYDRTSDLSAVSAELANTFCLTNGRELLARFIAQKSLSSDDQIRQVLYNRCYLPVQEALLERLEEEHAQLAPLT